MDKMLQVRNVPEDLHRTLKARAALAGMSLSEYVLRELRRTAEKPTPEELRRRIESRRPVTPRVAPADLLAEERAAR
jgi:plasmid stability protein